MYNEGRGQPPEHSGTPSPAEAFIPPHLTDRNEFLSSLSTEAYDLFRPHLTGIGLKAGERIQIFGGLVERVIFPHSGAIALTLPMHGGRSGGAIVIGRENLVGALAGSFALPALYNADVCLPGAAACLSSWALRQILEHSAVRLVLERRHAALMMQAHQNALCTAVHHIAARFARLLLELQDRAGENDIPLAQNKLAEMLGAQRTTVNQVVHGLQSAGVINPYRGGIRIAEREALERRACECYGWVQ